MIIYLINILFFTLIGISEGIFWHFTVNKLSTKTLKNIHIPLVLIRMMWFIFLYFKTNEDFASISNLILCYPFIHLGVLYQTRHMLEPRIYKDGFFSNPSESSTSIWDRILPITYGLRYIMFLFGTIFYIVWNRF